MDADDEQGLRRLATEAADLALRVRAAGLVWASVLAEAQAQLDESDVDVDVFRRSGPARDLSGQHDLDWLRWWYRGSEEAVALARLPDAALRTRLAGAADLLADRWEADLDDLLPSVLRADGTSSS